MLAASTLSFLKGVKENNNREWFLEHKHDYERARDDIYTFTGQLISKLSAFDPTVPATLNPRECVMRIYRDVRFSKDKSPYKKNFGIAISANGKNFKGPGYYLHIEPGNSFVAGGAWYPEPEELKSIRQEIDYNSERWHELVDSETFRNAFGGPDQEGKLSRAPKGYPADHPDVEYLKLKSFTASGKLSDRELTSPGAVSHVTELFEKLNPFMIFLRDAIS